MEWATEKKRWYENRQWECLRWTGGLKARTRSDGVQGEPFWIKAAIVKKKQICVHVWTCVTCIVWLPCAQLT